MSNKIKKITLEEIKDEVAEALADSVDLFSNDLRELFMFGIKPVIQYKPDELVDTWINVANPTHIISEEDSLAEEQVQVAEVVDEDGKVLFNVFHEDGNLSFENP